MYKCSLCTKNFSRKWNANRHNSSIHTGFSVIYDNETKIKINNKNPYQNNPIKGQVPETNEKIILDIFGKMLQPFEELENLVTNKSKDEQIKFLSELLVEALSSSNPVRHFIDAIEFHHSLNAKLKFIEYISKSMNVTPIVGESFLTDLIKNNRYYKNKVNTGYKDFS